MSLLSVAEARARLLAGVEPVDVEAVPLSGAAGRVLAEDLAATLTQPPFPASAMDGYAVRAADATKAGATLRLVGESRAGTRYSGRVGPGETARIFTGAPVPDGADAILIQENTTAEGGRVLVNEPVETGRFIRPAGLDFRAGDVLLKAGRRLDARAVSLAAAMNHARIPVRRRPVVAVLATGDELVPPGTAPGPDQIVSSNGAGMAAFVLENGGLPRDLGIGPDEPAGLGAAIDRAAGADVLVVIGGASVGDHDIVQDVLRAKGMELGFWRVAMRPGKPMMVGRLGATRILGLPGNPVSALVCATIFLRPLLAALLGLPPEKARESAILGADMGENDQREDYVRATIRRDGDMLVATPFSRQDSSMLATLAASDGLIVRPPNAPPATAGSRVPIVLFRS